jgi:hypothetical protein
LVSFFVWQYPVGPLRAALGLGPSLQSPGETELRTQLPRRIDGLDAAPWPRRAEIEISGLRLWRSEIFEPNPRDPQQPVAAQR